MATTNEADQAAYYQRLAQASAAFEWYAPAWKTGAVDGEDLSKIRAAGGYQAIVQDRNAQIGWQDLLDHVFQTRWGQVTQEVFGKRSYEDLMKVSNGNGLTFDLPHGGVGSLQIDLMQVGAGRNVVGLHYLVRAWEPKEDVDVRTAQRDAPIRIALGEHMAMSAVDMAGYLRWRADTALTQHQQQQADLVKSAASPSDPRGGAFDVFDAIYVSIREGMPHQEDDRYTTGFRDALESMVIALREEGVVPEAVKKALATVKDAYGNNVDEDDDAPAAPAP